MEARFESPANYVARIFINGFEMGAGRGILYDQDSHPEQCPRCGSPPPVVTADSAWSFWAERDPHAERGVRAIGGIGCNLCGLCWRVEHPLDAMFIG